MPNASDDCAHGVSPGYCPECLRSRANRAEADRDRLRALLAEARDWIASTLEGCPPCPQTDDLFARIDAALGGGEGGR